MFMGFHKNFLSSSVRELYRSGEEELAQRYLDRLNDLYGMGNPQVPDPQYAQPLDVFVWKQVQGEYEFQPHLAASDVSASLRYAFRVGLGQDRPEVLQKAMAFAQMVTRYFKENDYNAFETKMDNARLGGLIRNLENSAVTVFAELMVDTSLDMIERLQIYNRAPDDLKVRVYDMIAPLLRAQLERHQRGSRVPFETVLPEPPGLEAYRRPMQLLYEQQEKEREAGTDDPTPGVDRR